MKFNRLYLFVFLLTYGALNAEFDVEVSQGYRRDRLDVSVSGPNGKPNIQSESKFDRIDVYTSQLSLTYRKYGFYLQGIGGYGHIYDGHLSGATYANDNRKNKQASTTYHITGSYTADLSLTFGKQFDLPFSVTLTPHVGYGAYIQRFRFRKHLHKITNPFTGEVLSTTSSVKHINSRYRAHWQSPQIGVDFTKSFNNGISLFAKYSFLYPLRFHANAHLFDESSNTDLGFKDRAKAYKSYGNIAIGGLQWDITKNCFVKAEYQYMDFKAKHGHRKQGTQRQHLHSVHRLAQEVRLVLGYSF